MDRLNKIRIRNIIILTVLYIEGLYQVFVNPATLHSSGRVQGIFLGLTAAFLIVVIAVTVGGYQETRRVGKTLIVLKNFLSVLLTVEIVVKNKFKQFVVNSVAVVILLAACYSLICLIVPSLYNKEMILVLNILSIVFALAGAVVISGDLKKGKKVFKITDMPDRDRKRKKSVSKK